MNEMLELLAERWGKVMLYSIGGKWELSLPTTKGSIDFSSDTPYQAALDALRYTMKASTPAPTPEPTIARVVLSDGTELETFAGQPVSLFRKEVMPT